MSVGRWDLRGDLAAFSATEVLQLLSMARSTGILAVRNAGGEEAVVCFVSGHPVYGYSQSIPSPLDGLLMAGWQGEELWDRVVETVKQGKVDRGALAEALGRRVKEVIGRMLPWSEGEFTFSVRTPAPEKLIDSDFNLESLILDLVRQADEAGEEIR